jgi:hypothetical protein
MFSCPRIQLIPQKLSEKMMITVPLLSIIQWSDEQIGCFQLPDDPTATGAVQHGITKGSGQSIQNGCSNQKIPDFFGLHLENLGEEIIRYIRVRCAERSYEFPGVNFRLVPQIQPGELKTCDPSLRASAKRTDDVIGKGELHRVEQEVSCLFLLEPELSGTYLRHYASGPQARDGKGGIASCQNREAEVGGRIAQEQLHTSVYLFVVNDVIIVESKDQGVRIFSYVIHQQSNEDIGTGCRC